MKAAYLRVLEIIPVNRLLFMADTFISRLKNGIIKDKLWGRGFIWKSKSAMKFKMKQGTLLRIMQIFV
jgi:hypothetical protein